MAEERQANQQQRKEAQFFSRVRFQDQKQNYSLTFKYWNGLLSFDISKVISQDGGGMSFQSIQAAYFSPMKARIFSSELTKFIDNAKSNPVGINLGAGETQKCVTFMRVKDNVELYVCDVTPDGKKEKEVVFEFVPDRNFALSIKNYDKMDFDRVMYNGIEIEVIRDMLRQFADAMLGGMAYGVMDYQKFQDNRVNGNINRIMNKLGIETGGSGGYNSNRGSSSASFFAKNEASNPPQNTSSTHRDIDDLDDLLDD